MISEEIQNAIYMVASPIGNLADLTERAKYILSKVDLIACEDSRVSGKLMHYLETKKPFISCHAHNELDRAQRLIDELAQGKSIAYLSDAGTPGISDPGNLLVAEIAKAGYRAIPIPGASSLTSLLSVCGFNLAKGFSFVGFLPRTKGKTIRLLEAYLMEMKTVLICLEAPYRIIKSLEIIAENFPEAQICLGRELTKIHEEVLRGTARELLNRGVKEKGEFTLAIYLNSKKKAKEEDEEN